MAAADLVIGDAGVEDVPALVILINDAYQVETGDSGVAFKHMNRFIDGDIPAFAAAVAAGRCLAARLAGKLVACLVWEAGRDGEGEGGALRYHFGPFAVDKACQGRGVGGALLEALYARARAAGAASVDIEVVQHRTDILPWYAKMGYVAYGEGPFPAPERTTRACHFILMRKALQA
jgi:GNAT superfamily N-acetyltransferase